MSTPTGFVKRVMHGPGEVTEFVGRRQEAYRLPE